MKCISRKICYLSKTQAEEALVHLRGKYQPVSGQGPVGVYHCSDCGCYHLTSSGEESDILKSEESQRRIKLQKEADYWERKYRHR